MAGYIKLYRKTLNNKIWLYDPTAWRIFEYLMMWADYKTGQVNKAHSTMSDFLNIEKSTLSRALTRLRNAKMVNTTRNPNYTTYSIVNWHKYQDETQQDTQPKRNTNATKTQHTERSKALRSKEKEEESTRQWLVSLPLKDKTYFSDKYKNIELEDELEKAINWLNMTGKRYKNYKAFLENWFKKAESWAKEKSKIDNSDIKIPDYLKDFERTKNEPNVG